MAENAEGTVTKCSEEEGRSVGPVTAGSDASGVGGMVVDWGSYQPREQRCGKRRIQSKRPWRTCLKTGMRCTRTPNNMRAGVYACRTEAMYGDIC